MTRLTDEQLSKLNTKRLLSHYRAEHARLRRLEKRYCRPWDPFGEEDEDEDTLAMAMCYVTKLKKALDKREHVER